MGTFALPLSFGQKRLWFLARLAPHSPAYNVHAEIPIATAVDTRAFEHALAAVAARHEVLRSTFPEREGEPQQLVHDTDASAVPAMVVSDLSALPGAERDNELQRLARQNAATPFDLASGPVWRCRLVRLGPHAHVLLLALHHIVADAWSIGLLWREFSAAYLGAFTGRTPALPPLEIQYGDYAVWQRERLQGERLAALEGRWLRRLAGAPMLALPLDHPRPRTMQHEGAECALHLPAATVAALRALARQEATTPFAVLLAGFAAVLGQWARQDDVVFGTMVNARQRTELEPLIGFFVHTLPLRIDTGGRATLRTLVARARQVLQDALADQELPFERLLELLQLPRDLSRNPLFQVTIQYLPAAPGAFATGGAPVLQAGTGGAIFDLALSLWDDGAAMRGVCEYDRRLLEAFTVQRVLADLATLLSAGLSSPDAPLDTLPTMGADERRRLIASGCAPAVDGVPPVAAAIVAAAAATPDATAIVGEDLHWTYRELVSRSEHLACHLSAAGVRAEDRVALCLGGDTPWYAVAVLATWRLGAAFVPVERSWPPARRAAVLDDAAPRVQLALAAEDTVPGRPWLSPAVSAAQPASAALPAMPADHDALAYLLYTSGSTGTPKGVAMGQRALAHEMAWLRSRFPLAADDVLLHKTPVGFDASVWELLLPLMCGSRLALPPPGAHRDPTLMAEQLRRFDVTVLQVVPSMLRPLLEQPGGPPVGMLRCLFVGGEALPQASARAAYEALQVELVNLYGPTETCIQSSFYVMQPDDGEDEAASVAIGRPVDGTRLYVVDDALRLLPPGRVGELCIGGAGLARGYWRRPAATAQRFVPDPFGPEPGARMFRTGDLARWRADGMLEFRGRCDGANKLRGNRLELGEVEATMLAHADVRQAAAVIVPDKNAELRLVAHVSWLVDARGSPAALRGHLAARLPDYMLPSVIVEHETLPLLASGKIDRAALPPPPAATSTVAVGPRDALERSLRDLWLDVLQRGVIGVEDDFFADLGGHSLLAVRLNARLVDFFELELPLQRLFERPTIAGYAQALREDPVHGGAVARIEALLESLEDDADGEMAA